MLTGPMLSEFDLDPSVTHLNHGSFGAVPRAVSEAQRLVRARAEANPMRFHRVEAPGLRAEARATGAELLGVRADEVGLVRNVTEAVSTVFSALAWQRRLGPGDVVLLTQQTYGAVRLAVQAWCARTGASYDVVPHPVDATAEAVVAGYRAAAAAARQRGERVALVVVDQISSPTGAVLPVARVTAMARELGGVSFVDAAHVPGHLRADPEATGADFWSGTWHKWGFAPRGTSALWVAEPEREGTVPLTTSWLSAEPFPQPFDVHGTDDYSGWLCLRDAAECWSRAGGLDIADRSNALLDKAVALVTDVLPAADAPVPVEPAPCLRLVPLPSGVADTEASADALYRRLSEERVEVQVTPYDGHGYLRLSAAVYNELADYERLAEVLPGALGDVA